MRSNKFSLRAAVSGCAFLGLVLAAGLVAGCAGTPKKQASFFTSGNRAADQRATQRVEKNQQMGGAAARGGSGPGIEQVQGRQTLYERLGGEAGLKAIVDDFTPRVLQDPRVNWDRSGVQRGGFFSHESGPVWKPTPANVAALKTHLVQFFTLASGGPPRYEGKELPAVHKNMQISNPEFDAVAGDMKATLDRFRIPDTEQKELLAIIESTRPEIVTKR